MDSWRASLPERYDGHACLSRAGRQKAVPESLSMCVCDRNARQVTLVDGMSVATLLAKDIASSSRAEVQCEFCDRSSVNSGSGNNHTARTS